MYKKLFINVAIIAACICADAQTTIAPDLKGTSNKNPISSCIFCADPTALEYDGRLYVYGSNDHQEFIANGKKGDNSYGAIKSIVVFSTADMMNWTFHGTIDTKKLCSNWVSNPWWHGYGVSWAPSVTWRHNEETGKDEFFLYFCNSSHGVGVLKAESPIGPWSSPNRELMITYDTPGANPQGTNANFDPGVVIDDNGVGWISFGGLGSNNIMPDAARIIKLKPSMTEVDGEAAVIHAPYHFEANELNVIGGKYVYTYCSNWADRNNTEWNNYKSAHGINVSAPGGGTMCYMVSDNPLDPNSWVYKGYYGPGVSGNNHSHLQKFKGEYYHLYHNHGSILLDAMKNAGLADASAGDYRSICINKATVDESTATVSPVTLNTTGPSYVGDLNPYELQQAETMGNSGGINYENFTNIEKNTAVSTLNNDASRNLQIKMNPGAWIQQRRINFGDNGAAKFTIRARGTDAKMELRLTRTGSTVGTIEFSTNTMSEHTVDIPDPSKLKGIRSVYFTLISGQNVVVDAWQFTEVGSDGINEITNNRQPSANTKTYDLSGRRVSDNQQHRGIVIKNGKKVWH